MHLLSPFVVVCVLVVHCINASWGDNNFNTYRSNPADESTTQRNNYDSMICLDIKPQHNINIDEIQGIWYANEIIMHTHDVPGVYQYDSCVMIQLSDFTDQMRRYDLMNNNNNNNNNNRNYNYGRPSTDDGQQQLQSSPGMPRYSYTKYIRLLWTEKDDNLEYTFNYTMNHPGLWNSVGDQRGSFVTLNQYIQFAGSVQVVKAVNDHLVLTFCGSDIKSSIYTVVLSREVQGLSQEELRSIRGLLNRKHLSTESIRKVCVSSGNDLKSFSGFAFLIMGLIYLLSK